MPPRKKLVIPILRCIAHYRPLSSRATRTTQVARVIHSESNCLQFIADKPAILAVAADGDRADPHGISIPLHLRQPQVRVVEADLLDLLHAVLPAEASRPTHPNRGRAVVEVQGRFDTLDGEAHADLEIQDLDALPHLLVIDVVLVRPLLQLSHLGGEAVELLPADRTGLLVGSHVLLLRAQPARARAVLLPDLPGDAEAPRKTREDEDHRQTDEQINIVHVDLLSDSISSCLRVKRIVLQRRKGDAGGHYLVNPPPSPTKIRDT